MKRSIRVFAATAIVVLSSALPISVNAQGKDQGDSLTLQPRQTTTSAELEAYRARYGNCEEIDIRRLLEIRRLRRLFPNQSAMPIPIPKALENNSPAYRTLVRSDLK